MNDKTTMYTKDEVAEKLRTSRRTVDRLMKRGDIRYNKIGGQVRFSDRQVLDYQKRTEV